MEKERQEVLQKVRNFLLGKGDGEFPMLECIEEFYETDPEFRKAFDEDGIIDKLTRLVRDSRQANLTRLGRL